jgi:hypothetical protein
LVLYCPFCNAQEDGRVDATDSEGNKILLVMFNCPFSYKFNEGEVGDDEKMQKSLEKWKIEHGEEWLESVGPIMKERELRNMERASKIKR